jgi:hypothetical protein
VETVWNECLLTEIPQAAFTVQFALLLVSLSAGLGKNFIFLDGNEYSRMASVGYSLAGSPESLKLTFS